jgi:glycosyltransferase involved in cell wall biosynthesis
MRIGVDAREIQDGVVTGIGRPLANFISWFSSARTGHDLVLFSEKAIDSAISRGSEAIVLPPAAVTLLWDQWRLPRALLAHRIDLFYSPYYKVPLVTNIRIVSQVLDLVYPPYRTALGPFRRLYYATFGRAFARKAISIITDSEHAKRDIIRLWRIAPSKITVIPLGLSARYVPVHDENLLAATRNRFHLPNRFLLYLGNFKPHKNVGFLIRVFARLALRFPDYKLVLAGPMDSHGRKMQEIAADEGIADKVVFTGIVRETDRPEALLSLADLFVFPSLYEGFGLPPLEAMACGTPVAVSRETSLPEVVGDAGVLFDPKNIDETCDTIARLLSDSTRCKRFADAGLDRAAQFREEQTAGRVCSHLLSMLPGRS